MTKTKTSFGKLRQPKKEYRHTGERARTRLLNALSHVTHKVRVNGQVTDQYMTEDSYLQEVVKQSLTDSKLMMQVFGRLSPQAKSLAPTVSIEFPENGTPVQKMEAVLNAVVRGEISPDVGITITAMIKQTSDVNEVTELMERMQRLEDQIRQQAADKAAGNANG